jgi:quercetin dioxygenase-like cupin family protein
MSNHASTTVNPGSATEEDLKAYVHCRESFWINGSKITLCGSAGRDGRRAIEIFMPPCARFSPAPLTSPTTLKIIEGDVMFSIGEGSDRRELHAWTGKSVNVPVGTACACRNNGYWPATLSMIVNHEALSAILAEGSAPEELDQQPTAGPCRSPTKGGQMTRDNIDERLNFLGSIAVVRISHARNADGIAVIENRLPYGHATPLHVHISQDEVFHVLRGSVRFEIGGKTILAKAGDLMNAPKGIPHRFIVESKEGADVMVITAGGDFERFVREVSSPWLGQLPPPPTEPMPADIESLACAAERNRITIMGPPLTLLSENEAAA